MKTLDEIINGYQSTFERMSTMAVACRLNTAACCGNEAEAVYSKEFCACVHCILCCYVVSGSVTAVEIPCDVPILLWIAAKKYVINWFIDYNIPYDDFDSDDDFDLTYVDFDSDDDFDLTDDDFDSEDMMYPDGSSYFTTKDMEAEYDHTDDYTKDTEVPDYSTKQLNAAQYKAELIETMAASCTELNWFQVSELIDQLSDMSDYYANI